MPSEEPAFLPYGRQCLGEEEIEAVVRVLRSDFLTQGPEIERFEDALRERTGAAHAVKEDGGVLRQADADPDHLERQVVQLLCQGQAGLGAARSGGAQDRPGLEAHRLRLLGCFERPDDVTQ